jgi:hypothetical protein
MKSFDWKNVAELIGIAAIVASLIFVGVQVRQDRKFAQAQSDADMLENRLGTRADMNEFAHILVKGNSGAQLDSTESLIVRNMVESEQDLVFLHAWRTRIGGGLSTNTPELIFAVFLYQNPAARKAWLQIDADMETLVDPLRSPESMTRTRESGSTAFRSRIKVHLAKLDDLGSKQGR